MAKTRLFFKPSREGARTAIKEAYNNQHPPEGAGLLDYLPPLVGNLFRSQPPEPMTEGKIGDEWLYLDLEFENQEALASFLAKLGKQTDKPYYTAEFGGTPAVIPVPEEEEEEEEEEEFEDARSGEEEVVVKPKKTNPDEIIDFYHQFAEKGGWRDRASAKKESGKGVTLSFPNEEARNNFIRELAIERKESFVVEDDKGNVIAVANEAGEAFIKGQDAGFEQALAKHQEGSLGSALDAYEDARNQGEEEDEDDEHQFEDDLGDRRSEDTDSKFKNRK